MRSFRSLSDRAALGLNRLTIWDMGNPLGAALALKLRRIESAVRRKRKPIAHRFPVGIQLTFQILYHLGESVTLGVPRLVVYFFVPPREGHRLECDGLNLVDVAYGKIDDGTDAIVVGPIHNGCH